MIARCRTTGQLGLLFGMMALAAFGCRRSAESFSLRSAEGSPHAIEYDAVEIALADVDGDGRLDAIVAGGETGQLSILRGNGRGGFASATVVANTPAMHEIVAADIDADGHVDLLGAHHDSFDVHVLLGDGSGSLKHARSVGSRPGTKPHNHGLVVADFDEDGRLDALTSDQDQGSVALLLGDGRGGMALADGSPWTIGRGPYPPAVADLDGDHHLDVAGPLVSAAAIGVLRGNGRGEFVPAAGSTGPIADRPLSLALGDVDSDGRVDAVVAHDDITIATVLIGDGAGGLVPTATIDLGGSAFDLTLADINRDHALDLIGTRMPDGVLVMIGDGRGGFVMAPGSPFVVGAEPAALALGDLDDNGALDLVVANRRSRDVVVLRQG